LWEETGELVRQQGSRRAKSAEKVLPLFEKSRSMSQLAEVEIGLSAKGLGNLPRNLYENDFKFIVGDTEYRCPSFVACFLSPRICSLQRNDPTIREFHLDAPDPNHYFESILNLCTGVHSHFPRNEPFVRQISCTLWNAELYESISGTLGGDLTIETVIDRIRFQIEVGETCESEIAFCASHLYELESKDLCSLPSEVFSAIISHKSIRLKDEDSFYSMIHSRICEDRSFASLLEFVRFEYLSAESIRSFIEFMNESFDRMTIGIWASVCRRLSSAISVEVLNDDFRERFNSVGCRFSSSSPMDGLISYLTKKHGGHILDKGIVSITASGLHNAQSWPLRNLATVGNQTPFSTSNTPNSWICYDFKRLRVGVTDYSIRSRCDANANHLRCWRLDGSIDGLSWNEIDHQENNTSLNSQGAIVTLSIPEGHRGQYRMIRIQQTGKNSSGNDYLILSAIEFFGVFHEPKQYTLQCHIQLHSGLSVRILQYQKNSNCFLASL
jgi:hypothetical protein